jgi:predicted DNA-binding transcriptional regulator AlpA
MASLCKVLARFWSTVFPAVQTPPEPEQDRLLNTAQAAAMLGHSTKWIYRHLADLHFARRIGPRDLRFSLLGLRKWQDRQKV